MNLTLVKYLYIIIITQERHNVIMLLGTFLIIKTVDIKAAKRDSVVIVF